MPDPTRVFLSAALTAVVAILAIRAFALRSHLLDLPNERSSHTIPIPRLGGLGIVCGVWAAAMMTASLRRNPALWMALFSTLPLYLLVFDDILATVGQGLKQIPKLATQVAASTLLVFQAGFVLNAVTLPAMGYVSLGWFALPATFLWLVYVTNIYNFMDGIDGLAGSQGLLIATFLFGIALGVNASALPILALAVAGASAGFLFFNRPPASIIMGDVGSAFVGFLLAALGLIGEQEGVSFLTMPILLGPFLFDATYTLLRRLMRGENIFQAHRFHLYQRLVRTGVSPSRVDLFYAVALFPCGLSAAFLNRGRFLWSVTAFDAFLILALLGVWGVERRWRRHQGFEVGDPRPQTEI